MTDNLLAPEGGLKTMVKHGSDPWRNISDKEDEIRLVCNLEPGQTIKHSYPPVYIDGNKFQESDKVWFKGIPRRRTLWQWLTRKSPQVDWVQVRE